MSSVFFDTWAYVALGDTRDVGHLAAKQAMQWIDDNHWDSITSDYVLDETITWLHSVGQGLRFIDFIETQIVGGAVTLVPIDVTRRTSAVRWFRRLAPDTPRLSFTDCTSFALLEELQITSILTADRHFVKAGPKVHRLIADVRDRLVFRPPPR